MTLNAKIVGALRLLGGVGGYAALTAVLQYLSVSGNVLGLGIAPSLAGIIVLIAGAAEANIEQKTGKALFGSAVSV